MRVLLLDDEQLYLEVAKSCLEAIGAKSIHATTSPVEAASIVQNEAIDLVVTDLNMPGQDGLSFLRSLSEFGFIGGVIIVSGEKSNIVASAGQLGEKLGLNICGALSKPLDIAKLNLAFVAAKEFSPESGRSITKPSIAPKGLLTPIFHYQPQVDALSGELMGAEALLRGIDQEGQMFGPTEMLGSCNSKEESFALTERLYEIFCSDISLLRRRGFTNRFSFNVDAASLEMQSFAEMLLETSSRRQVETHGIVIELIESKLPKDETRLLEIIARLGMAGFEVAMDDFNTGASSYSLLRAGAFSEIKLDAGLVQSSATDMATAKFIANTIEIANDLDLRVVAEGVETESDLLRAKNMGVECIQGSLIAKPAPSDELMLGYGLKAPESRMAS